MTRVIGYGEDGLTHWGLCTRLGTVLLGLAAKYSDNSTPDECLVIYRPSLGRGKNVGEFDAILATKACAYLIESKWHRSSEFKKRKQHIVLSDSQIRRHKVMESYRQNWRIADAGHWSGFVQRCQTINPLGFEGIPFPASHTDLACNLEAILRLLAIHCTTSATRHICLFFASPGLRAPAGSEVKVICAAPHFDVIRVNHPPALTDCEEGLFEMI